MHNFKSLNFLIYAGSPPSQFEFNFSLALLLILDREEKAWILHSHPFPNMHVNLREYSVDSSSISEISDSNHNGEIDKSKFEFESKLVLYLSPFATFRWYIYIYYLRNKRYNCTNAVLGNFLISLIIALVND